MNMRHVGKVVVTLLLAGAAAQAQERQLIRIESVKASQEAVKIGEEFRLIVNVSTDPDWHVYSANGSWSPIEWVFDSGVPAERAGRVIEPPGKHVVDKELDYDAIELEGALTFEVPVRLKAEAKPGPLTLTGVTRGQVCDPASCMPFEIPFKVDVNVLEGEVVLGSQGPGPSRAAQAAELEYARKGFWAFLLLAIGGGLFSLVQPCVYPLIPITLTFFVKQAGKSRSHGIFLSSLYALGIIVTFTGLGFLLTVALGPRGAQIFGSNPWVNLGIAGLFFAFALTLFGVFELRLPSGLTSRLTGSGPKHGAGGAFLLGLLFSVVTFTCTIPIAATIFTIAAGSTQRMSGLVAMLAYSATMAFPFFLMGFFPSLIKEIPKSGGWLQTVKVTGGFLELALATQYLANADIVFQWGFFTRQMVLVVWVAIALMTAAYLLGLFRMKDDAPLQAVGFPRLMSAIVFGILTVYCLGGVFGRPTPLLDFALPPDLTASAAPAVSNEAGEGIFHDLETAEAEARKRAKPIFVEFTGAQ
ncbi:MAG: hypothetical protein HY716_00890 [Planctomycetes bacterium]|nr:hypothetical protein [Planctomycetota bacterium]